MFATAAEYLVSHGKTGAFGRFLSSCKERFVRGDRVVLESDRGLTLGTVLCEATARQVRLLEHLSCGRVLRRAGPEDARAHELALHRERQIYEVSRALALEFQLPMEIVDAELTLDGQRLILQFLLGESHDLTSLVDKLAKQFSTEVWLENLAVSTADHHQSGCGKPDCGRLNNSGGCDTCGSGGCSSCGGGKIDLRPYFAHLRDQLDARRTSLM
jgi:cell fate regulator YaaT (PSP1 superfamily)